MNLKKILLPLLILLIVSTTVVFANSTGKFNVSLFPISIIWNGQEVSEWGDQAIYNIDGSTYVPLRAFTKKVGGVITYDSNNNIIKVNTPTNLSAFAEISSSKEYKNFKVSVYSEKSIYESNELINVWGDMTYLGDEKISIRHGEPLLNFFIRDDQGNYYEAPHYVSSDNGFIDRNNQYFSPNNLWVITYFNRKFYQNDNINLKPGRYTIGLRPYFSTSELETTEVSDNLCTSVQITVK